jgi:sugar lactone lactonase YvrE
VQDADAGLLAQNDSSKVVKLDKNGSPSVAYSDTHTGGALAMNSQGHLFIVERGLRMKVEQLAPQRRVLTESFQGEPLDCAGGVINDLAADSRGGVYFTMGGLFYADPKGYRRGARLRPVFFRYHDRLQLRDDRGALVLEPRRQEQRRPEFVRRLVL